MTRWPQSEGIQDGGFVAVPRTADIVSSDAPAGSLGNAARRANAASRRRLGGPVVTADRAWGKLDIAIEITLIR
jgi:PIN domain nuclease of toxin-antitoxin system